MLPASIEMEFEIIIYNKNNEWVFPSLKNVFLEIFLLIPFNLKYMPFVFEKAELSGDRSQDNRFKKVFFL